VPRPPLHARRRHPSPAGSAAVGGPGAAPPRRRDRYFGGGLLDARLIGRAPQNIRFPAQGGVAADGTPRRSSGVAPRRIANPIARGLPRGSSSLAFDCPTSLGLNRRPHRPSSQRNQRPRTMRGLRSGSYDIWNCRNGHPGVAAAWLLGSPTFGAGEYYCGLRSAAHLRNMLPDVRGSNVAGARLECSR